MPCRTSPALLANRTPTGTCRANSRSTRRATWGGTVTILICRTLLPLVSVPEPAAAALRAQSEPG
ncbi:Uncharacterised protein [Mycobacteroides abscessus subsp. abscessus]|nr:Uncharacterised protein [Mycobacteroides abscessus subsp. abscessus]